MSKLIELTKGAYAIVDDEDYESLSKYSWRLDKDGYAHATSSTKDGRKDIYMHRKIMNTPKGMETDHINNNKLDNRRVNLRICTKGDNKCNMGKYNRKPTNYSSKYKGVYKNGKKWYARIKVKYKFISLGSFNDEISAAKKYDQAAIKFHGQYANINFPKGNTP